MENSFEAIEPLLTPEEVSKAIGADVLTLAKWRTERRQHRRRVPLPFVKISNKKIMYKASDVRAFIQSRTCAPPAIGEKSRRKRRAVSA